jgi:hypothetical protein
MGLGRNRLTAMVMAIVVSLALLALYAARPVAVSGATTAETRFAADWRAAVGSYADGTRAVEQSAQAARGNDLNALLGVYRQLHTTTAVSIDRFRQLQAPPGASEEYDAFLAALEGERSALRGVLAAAETSNTAALPQQITDLAAALADVVQARSEVDAAVAR